MAQISIAQSPSAAAGPTSSAGDVTASLIASFAAAKRSDTPYRHWNISKCVPQDTIDAFDVLPFPAPTLGGISGKREVHNATRKYFDIENRAAFPAIAAFSEAFQSAQVARAVESTFGTKIGGSYLRIEFAQDTNGFWLEPHSDLGVKLFTLLLYVSKDERHANLGTDIYDLDKRHVGRSGFGANLGMVFVPSKITLHGFEPRRIEGVRKSVIVNYVTSDWRAREQLAFPDQPIEV